MRQLHLLIILSILFFSYCKSPEIKSTQENWIPLFNGKDLEGWDIKITDCPLGENFKNTFTVKDSMLIVSYAGYDSLQNHFGHLYYKKKFSNYKLRLSYRFDPEWVKKAPIWTFLNSGVMVHSQSAESMEMNQQFPVSIEAQLLASNDTLQRPTMNVCTPGTIVSIDGKVNPEHCINSKSRNFKIDEWVNIEIIVHSDSLIQHIVNGDTVLTYSKPALNPGEGFSSSKVSGNFTLKDGYIALQAEGQSIQFKKVELLDIGK